MGLFNKTPEEKFEKASMASSGRKMLKLAEGGMQKAMTSVAYKYSRGFGLKKDLKKAKYWADKAADVKAFGESIDTIEAYFTKGNICLEFKTAESNKEAKESFKTAYSIALPEDKDYSYYKSMSGATLARLYMADNENLEEAKEILLECKRSYFPEAQFQLARYSYYIENNLVPAVKYFQELLDRKNMEGEDIIFEMEDITTDYLKKVNALKDNEVSLKTIDELEALLEFLTENQWEEYILEEVAGLIKRFKG